MILKEILFLLKIYETFKELLLYINVVNPSEFSSKSMLMNNQIFKLTVVYKFHFEIIVSPFLKYVSERSNFNVAPPVAKSISLPKMSVSD